MGVLRRARRRRIIGAGLVGGAAYHMGKSAGRNEESHDMQLEEQEGSSQIEELEKLGELHEKGVLDDEEFASAKRKLLG